MFRLGNSKAAAHFAVDLQCWFTVKHVKNKELISPNCTDHLQPLDISVNKAAKKFLRNEFQEWYAGKVREQLQGTTLKQSVDLCLSIVKSLGAKWMVGFYDYVQNKPEITVNGLWGRYFKVTH